MYTDYIPELIAILVSITAAFFSWLSSSHANKINKINALLALRDHYEILRRKSIDFGSQSRDEPEVLMKATKGSEYFEAKIQEIDATLLSYYKQISEELSSQ